MTKLPFLSSAILILWSVAGHADTKDSLRDSIMQSRELMSSVYRAYPSPTSSISLTAVPEGYTPLYISHYGRHGSRWLPSDKRYLDVLNLMDSLELTPFGKEVRAALDTIWEDARGHGGELTRIGQQQHRDIAKRMAANYPEIFSGHKHITAKSSTAGRCIMSMMSFCESLKESNPSLTIDKEASERDMEFISYTIPQAKSYTSGKISWGRQFREFRDSVISPDRLLSSIFANPEKIDRPRDFIEELYWIAADMQNVGLPIDLFRIFTSEELFNQWQTINHRMYAANVKDMDEGYDGPSNAVSLLKHIISTADEDLRTGASSAFLRFGHDTDLIRLLSLIQADGINYKSENPDEYYMVWRDSEISPMAANLQIIFFRNDKGHIIVKALLNEREITFPLESRIAPYYDWSQLRQHFMRRIARQPGQSPMAFIDTRIGTAHSTTLTTGLFGKGTEELGQTLPAVIEPFGMNFWTPQTQDTELKCKAPYYYEHDSLQGFRNSHWIVGGCTQDYGSMTLMPLGGSLRLSPQSRATPFSHDDEIATPSYYSVVLPDEHLTAEMTGTCRAGIFRFTYDNDDYGYLVVNPNSDEGVGYIEVDPVRRQIRGYNPVHRIYQGKGEEAGFNGYFVIELDRQPEEWGTFCDDTPYPGKNSIGGRTGIGAYFKYRTKAKEPVIAKAASSFVSIEGALANLEAEIPHWSFDTIHDRLTCIWKDHLSKIEIDTPDDDEMAKFYGAMYRSSFLPRTFNDVDGRYPSFAGGKKICLIDSGHSYYDDFSMWDTYRALHPLLNIILPSKNGDMMQSLVLKAEQGGWLPIFPCWNSYTAAMIGDHAIVSIADAYVKGVEGIDIKKAYKYMRQNAFSLPDNFNDYANGMGRRALDSYLKHGYIPLEDSVKYAFHQQEQVSRTLEYAFDDFALAQVAKKLGHSKDYRELMRRSGNWRNVIDPSTGYACGRHDDGSFSHDESPFWFAKYITEGAPCHYTWYVPHDPLGLIEAQGGRETYVAKLDSMFTEGRYWHGNEPCHQVAWMFNYAGQPHKTQKWIRHILETEYLNTPGGLAGNDDAGQMSAWYMFASMGFYPVTPATKEYMISSPIFRRVRINLENGNTFTIEAPKASSDNMYIRRMTLNGKDIAPISISHDDIMSGGTLFFDLTSEEPFEETL